MLISTPADMAIKMKLLIEQTIFWQYKKPRKEAETRMMALTFVIYAVALAAAVPLRIWQYMTVIDPVTGFYNDSHISIWLLAVVVIVAVALILLSVSMKKQYLDQPLKYGTVGLGLCYCATGLVIIIIYLIQVQSKYPAAGILGMELSDIVGLLCGLAFLVLAILFALRKTSNTLMYLMMVVPILWSITMLWRTFIGYQTILNISEHLFEILSYIFITLFFLSSAYVVSGFGKKNHQKKMVIFGLTGSLFSITNAMGKIYIQMQEVQSAVPVIVEMSYLLDIVVGILMAVSCVYICFGADRALPGEVYAELYENQDSEGNLQNDGE